MHPGLPLAPLPRSVARLDRTRPVFAVLHTPARSGTRLGFQRRYVFPAGQPGAHNGPVTDGQAGAVCPRCGSSAAVYSVEELAALAKSRLGGQQQGHAASPQPGYAAEPQAGPVPGYAAQPQAGPLPGPGGRPGRGSRFPGSSGGGSFSVEDDLAGAALAAATGFIGRAIGRRVQRAYSERVLPALAAKQEEMLRTQIAIAERHPDLRACLADHVVFLAGGSRALPMPNLNGLTAEQADVLVASLRNG
jgi:hypothetical protein